MAASSGSCDSYPGTTAPRLLPGCDAGRRRQELGGFRSQLGGHGGDDVPTSRPHRSSAGFSILFSMFVVLFDPCLIGRVWFVLGVRLMRNGARFSAAAARRRCGGTRAGTSCFRGSGFIGCSIADRRFLNSPRYCSLAALLLLPLVATATGLGLN